MPKIARALVDAAAAVRPGNAIVVDAPLMLQAKKTGETAKEPKLETQPDIFPLLAEVNGKPLMVVVLPVPIAFMVRTPRRKTIPPIFTYVPICAVYVAVPPTLGVHVPSS